MFTTEDAAKRVLNTLYGEDPKVGFIDPITISIIVGIIGAILSGIRIYCEWKNSQKKDLPVESTKKNSKLFTRRYVRKHLTKEQYKRDGKALVNALLKNSTELTPDESEQLFNNVIGDKL